MVPEERCVEGGEIRQLHAGPMGGASLVPPCRASGPACSDLPAFGYGSGQPNPHEESGK